MNKLLSIIIPRYSEQNINNALYSIYTQSQFDKNYLEIIIADDNPETPLQYIPDIGIDIRHEVMVQNGGPGLARQLGIDKSNGDYLMFIDADDSLYSCDVLYKAFNEIRKFPETDYLYSQWIEELRNDETGEIMYVNHDLENTWMHGKVIKKSLLTEHDVRFHPDLRVHEDSYFLSLVAEYAQSRRLLQSYTYLWRHSADTITRRDKGLYLYKDFPTFIKSIGLANEQLRGSKNIEYKVVQLLLYCYFTLQQDIWIKEDVAKYRSESIKTLKSVMKNLWNIYDNSPEDLTRRVYAEERAKAFKNNEIEHYSLYEWINMLKKED